MLTDKEKLERKRIDYEAQKSLAHAQGINLTWVSVAIEIIDYILKNLIDQGGKRMKLWRNVRKYARFGLFVADKFI